LTPLISSWKTGIDLTLWLSREFGAALEKRLAGYLSISTKPAEEPPNRINFKVVRLGWEAVLGMGVVYGWQSS
jgi:hypothetical protein